MELTFDRILGILGIVLAIVLVVLDKAGKLRGPILLVLLGLAAIMTLPLALGNSWVTDTPRGMLKASKMMLMTSMVAMCFSIIALWISPSTLSDVSSEPKETHGETPPTQDGLKGNIMRIGVGDNPGTRSPGGLLVVNIRNYGAPVSMDPDGWRVRAKLKDGRVIEGKIVVNWKRLSFDMSGKGAEVYTKDKDLLQKSVSTPIPTNGQIFGVIPFAMAGISKDALIEKGTIFVLQFKDVLGRSYQAEHSMLGKSTGPKDYIPGMGSTKDE